MKKTTPATKGGAKNKAQTPAATGPAKSTQVGKTANTAVGTVNYGNVGPHAGLEGADRDSFAIAFLRILQKLSPELDKNNKEHFIDGAEEGDILNTANKEVYDGQEGILVMPVSFKRCFTAWTIREKGGGFKGEHLPSDPILITTKPDSKNRQMLPDQTTQMVDTRMHGIVLLNGDIPMPGLIAMAVSQIKHSKRWMTAMQEVQVKDNLPTFAHIYKLSTGVEKKGDNTWMGWVIDPHGPVTEQEHIDVALGMYQALQSGAAKMNAAQMGDPDAGTE